MIELVWIGLLLGGALLLAYGVARPPVEFVVTVRNSMGTARKGKVTEAFLDAIREVCAEFGVSDCEVRGVARGRRIALRFSSNLPPGAQQRLRNWWAMSGWSAGGVARRGPRL